MNPPLPPPSTEPMLYFLSNSLVVVAAAGVLFFVLGLWFGFLTWGRYKRRARAFQEETSLLRHEIASLKRRIAAEAVEPSRLVSINDEGPAVEIQPLLFPMNANPIAVQAALEPADLLPLPVNPVATASMIVGSKAKAAVMASLPEAVGSDGKEVSARPPPAKPSLISPAPAVPVVAKAPAVAVPEPRQPVELPAPVTAKAAASLPPVEKTDTPAQPPLPPPVVEPGPVISLAAAAGPMPAHLLSGLASPAAADASLTSQMNASLHVTHDAGLPEFPALPGLGEALATTQLILPEQKPAAAPAPPPPSDVSRPAPLSPSAPAVSLRVQPPSAPGSQPELKVPKPVPAPVVSAVSANGAELNGHLGAPVVSALPPPPPPAADPGSWFAKEMEEGQGVEDPQLGFCYTEQPERWDDLTLLRGLGEGLQERLHQNGIYTFKQIALWTEHQSDEAGQRIHARERVQRDRWVQQATDLHFLKYGERIGG